MKLLDRIFKKKEPLKANEPQPIVEIRWSNTRLFMKIDGGPYVEYDVGHNVQSYVNFMNDTSGGTLALDRYCKQCSLEFFVGACLSLIIADYIKNQNRFFEWPKSYVDFLALGAKNVHKIDMYAEAEKNLRYPIIAESQTIH